MNRPTSTRCRALVAGFGVPAQRDLDFGRQVISYLEPFQWPAGVVVEELPHTACLALHRLQELRPPVLLLVGAVSRGIDPPGTIRKRRLGPVGGPEASSTFSDLEHTLGLLRQWGGLPPDTLLIEVEPADCGFGLGFSEELGPALDAILDLIRTELEAAPDADVDPEPVEIEGPAPSDLAALVDYAQLRREAKLHERLRATPPPAHHDRVEVVTRSQPWGMGLESGGDWCDVIPLEGGLLGVVMGEVPGRGVEAAALKTDLRVVTQAYAFASGEHPTEVVRSLDRWITATGRGAGTTVTYLMLEPSTGRLRMCSAGHCPPLVLGREGESRYLHDEFTPVVGAAPSDRERDEIVTRLQPGDTLLLFTDGLVEQPSRPLAFGLLELAEAAESGPPGPVGSLDALCDHLLAACVDRRRRSDDVSLLALRLLP